MATFVGSMTRPVWNNCEKLVITSPNPPSLPTPARSLRRCYGMRHEDLAVFLNQKKREHDKLG
jgi:hypothetical protein